MNLGQTLQKIRPAVSAGQTALLRLFAAVRRYQRTIPWKYQEHAFSVLFVTSIFLILLIHIRSGAESVRQQGYQTVSPYLNLSALDLRKPMHKALFAETLDVFYPDAPAHNDSLAQLAERYAAEDIAALQTLAAGDTGLSWSKLGGLTWMYISFVLGYLVVMALTYYGVQTMAIFRFLREKQNQSPCLEQLIRFVRNRWPKKDARAILNFAGHAAVLLGKAFGKALGYLILFSPAYVIAYSFRSRVNTDTFFFMVLLGVVSNGLLIMYAQKFYTFLVAESRKGYVQTAIVKNLRAAFTHDEQDGIPYQKVFRIKKQFPGHIFQHIYLNARYQYILTLKEQASFLITGLIIIEMALNIHGHLCYELLQNILYRQYDVVIAILLGLFFVVKATEIGVDVWMDREAKKYENME